MKHRTGLLALVAVLALPRLALSQQPKTEPKSASAAAQEALGDAALDRSPQAATAPVAACPVQGVWELVSGTEDGKPYPATLHARKLITRQHWAWVQGEGAPPSQLLTVGDTLRALRASLGGTGTYTVNGSTYTETIDVYPLPGYQGISLPFACRVEGDRFYQSGKSPVVENGKVVREVMLEEVYRRIE